MPANVQLINAHKRLLDNDKAAHMCAATRGFTHHVGNMQATDSSCVKAKH